MTFRRVLGRSVSLQPNVPDFRRLEGVLGVCKSSTIAGLCPTTEDLDGNP